MLILRVQQQIGWGLLVHTRGDLMLLYDLLCRGPSLLKHRRASLCLGPI